MSTLDLAALDGGIVVSCQARADNPLHGPSHMTAMARAAVLGGAVGIRAQGADDIAAIHDAVEVPIIGIHKILDGREVYITPTFEVAAEVAAAGADIVALDATDREREGGPAPALIRRIREELGVPVMADVDDLASGLAAADAGAELVATTLSGYTGGPVPPEPDLRLIEELAAAVAVPVVAEGRIARPEDVRRAFSAGASIVVVGTAITNPWRITERFVRAAPGARR